MEWCRGPQQAASGFTSVVTDKQKGIVCQINSTVAQTVTNNRKKLISILSSILSYTTNDHALCGKEAKDNHMQKLLDGCIEAGDKCERQHKMTSGNVRHTSHRTQ